MLPADPRGAVARCGAGAVVGVGGFGRHHARIYGELAKTGEVTLVGLVDKDPARAKEHADKLSVPVVPRVAQ